MVRLAVLALLGLVALGSCDECLGIQRVEGVVHDQLGAPIGGALVTSCAPDLMPCRSTSTDAAGHFVLDVEIDGPASDDQCVLRPVVITRDGCVDVELGLAANPDVSHVDVGVVVMTCP
jgi:hypothetical protein